MPFTKVHLAASLTEGLAHQVRPDIRGSSRVMMFTDSTFNCESEEYKVRRLALPVGPVSTEDPSGRASNQAQNIEHVLGATSSDRD